MVTHTKYRVYIYATAIFAATLALTLTVQSAWATSICSKKSGACASIANDSTDALSSKPSNEASALVSAKAFGESGFVDSQPPPIAGAFGFKTE